MFKIAALVALFAASVSYGQCPNGSCPTSARGVQYIQVPRQAVQQAPQGVVTTATASVPVGDATAQVNGLRASLGLRPVANCPILQAAAQRHAERQAASMAMYHSSMANENVAQAHPGMAVVPLWRQSEGHYRNMMNPAHVTTGYGEAVGRDGRLYATQLFGDGSAVTVSSQPVQPVQAPPVVPKMAPSTAVSSPNWGLHELMPQAPCATGNCPAGACANGQCAVQGTSYVVRPVTGYATAQATTVRGASGCRANAAAGRPRLFGGLFGGCAAGAGLFGAGGCGR